ncbi:MAG TPA: nicotinate phosphoribosyltransferase [Thermoanaerobaculia bacterium]|nr:nicotinate phosphoribosyltransferase [Thermoanaerobaculia bacterium]
MFSPALLTDLYELTMAYGYWKAGKDRDDAVFHLYFRENPFEGGYTIAAGLEEAIRYLEALRFQNDDLRYLATVRGNDDQRLFPDEFLAYLTNLKITLDIDAVPEGTVVFPQEPMLRVVGPILQAQIVETALLNILNFQSLIATKAARVVYAAKGDPVIDFGLRRAQGVDGALAASRAIYIGGCDGTSNTIAGATYDIPVKGTHAHSWVMAFDSELEAFEKYAEVQPNNCLLLVDTYNTMHGVQHAIEVGRKLRANGHELIGIRLDSGDLAYLSIEARKMLDAAGFPNAAIAASNELDEHLIASLKDQGARINVWGVGTKLITAYDQPALGGVYKLSALRPHGGQWQYRIKISEQAIKTTNPGMLQVRRFNDADMIFDELAGEPTNVIVDPLDLTRRRAVTSSKFEDLLVPIFRKGKRVYELPTIEEIRKRRAAQLDRFHPGVKRFVHPHRYPVGLEKNLFDLKTRLILEARGAPA